MTLSDHTIEELKCKSCLAMEQVKDYDSLALLIFEATKRRIGSTTLKRLFGRIQDERNTSAFTLNTIALYLGYESWEIYLSVSMRSEKDFTDDSIYIAQLNVGQRIRVAYLNRVIEFNVVIYNGDKILQVISAENSSLQIGDYLYIYRFKKGEILEAKTLIRNGKVGNYRSKGRVLDLTLL